MESNISRDHIALEAMRTIIEKSMTTKMRLKDKIKFHLGFKSFRTDTNMPGYESTAKMAYAYADAMIAEREKNESVNQ